MDFEFSDEQEQLRDAVRRWVDKGFGFERRHALAKAGGKTREVLGELNELGLAGLVVPDTHGGMGFGAVEAMVVMEELGRGLVNAPYAQAALVAPTLLSRAPAALQDAWLPKIAGGEALVVLAQQERASRYHLDRVATRAVEAGGGWKLSGTKVVVPAGDEADAFIVSARISGDENDPAGVALFVVDKGAAGATLRGYPTQDGARAADLVLVDTPATLLTRKGHDALEHACDVAIAALCAEAVGLMDSMVAITVDYMHQRKQFGVTHRHLPGAAPSHRRREDAAGAGPLDELLRQPQAGRAGDTAAPRAVAGQGAAGQLDALRRPAVHADPRRHRRHRRVRVQPLLQAADGLELSFGDTLHHLGEVSARMHDSAGVFA